jgi:hypothetical protein
MFLRSKMKGDVGKDKTKTSTNWGVKTLYWFTNHLYISSWRLRDVLLSFLHHEIGEFSLQKTDKYNDLVTETFPFTFTKPSFRRVSLGVSKQTSNCCWKENENVLRLKYENSLFWFTKQLQDYQEARRRITFEFSFIKNKNSLGKYTQIQ